MQVIQTFVSIKGPTIGEILLARDGYAFLHFERVGDEVNETLVRGFQTREEAEDAFWCHHDDVYGN